VIAIDTNIILRVAIEDDPRQTEAAQRLLTNEHCYVAASVMLECAWVLANVYKQRKPEISRVLQGLLNSETLTVERSDDIQQALHWYAAGLDFADAVHLATADKCTALATFDRSFVRNANALQTPISVYHP
jgi:predicted nucleic-acid-binding protein